MIPVDSTKLFNERPRQSLLEQHPSLTQRLVGGAAWLLKTAASPITGPITSSIETAILGPPLWEITELKELIKKVIETPDALTIDDVCKINKHFQGLIKNEAYHLKELAPGIKPEPIKHCTDITNFFNTVVSYKDTPDSLDALNYMKGQLKDPRWKKKLKEVDSILDKILNYNQGYLAQTKARLYQETKKIEQFSKGATTRAHSDLSESRAELNVLYQAIDEKDADAVQKSCKKLEEILTKMRERKDLVFTEQPLSDKHLKKLNDFIELLPSYYNRNLRDLGNELENHDSQEIALKWVSKFRSIIEKYYKLHEGPVGKACGIAEKSFDDAVKKAVNEGKEALTGQAKHPLLRSRKTLFKLQQAIEDIDIDAVQKLSRELEQFLEEMLTHSSEVFSKKPLSVKDRSLLEDFKAQLSYFYNENSDLSNDLENPDSPTRKIMLNYFEINRLIIDHYYKIHEGVVGQLDDTLQKNIERIMETLEETEESLKSLLAKTSKRITEHAPTLLLDSREKLYELRQAIIDDENKTDIETFSKELEKLLGDLVAQKDFVFSKKKRLSDVDEASFNQLRGQLSRFYSDHPPDKKDMRRSVKAGISAIERYYNSYEGIFGQAGDSLQKNINPILAKLKGLVAETNEMVTGGEAYRLLSGALTQLNALKNAINRNDELSIQRSSHELLKLLHGITTQLNTVFQKTPISNNHVEILDELKESIRHFDNDIPSNKPVMLAAIERALPMIETYCVRCEGIATQTGEILYQTVIGPSLKEGEKILNNCLATAKTTVTDRAHRSLSGSYEKLVELQQAVNANNTPAMRTKSSELESLLTQMLENENSVFTIKPLTPEDRNQIIQLRDCLASFYGKALPAQWRFRGWVNDGIERLEPYYKAHEGMAGQTVATIKEGINPLVGNIFDQLEEKMTGGKAYRLLSDAHKKLEDLKTAIKKGNKGAIAKLSEEVRQCLQEITTQAITLFTKISTEDIRLLNVLKGRLPDFYSDHPPAKDSMVADVVAGLETISPYCAAYKGLFAQMVDPFVTRFEHLGETNINNVLGGTSVGDFEGASNGEGTVSDFLNEGGALLEKILGKGGQAISKRALGGLASILTLGLQHVIGKMGDSADFRQPRMTINGIIGAIGAARDTGNWSALWTDLKDVAEVLRPIKIYVSGFLLPVMGSGGEEVEKAEEVYFKHMSDLQKVMDTSPVDPENQNWEKLAEKEKTKLVDNSTKFLTMKHIYENICHLHHPDGERFYIRLLMNSKQNITDPDVELKKLFFGELEKKKVNFATRLYAKIQYFFYGSIVGKYIAEASNIYFDEIFNYIKRHKDEKFDTLRNQVTNNFTRYLTNLGDAYRNVAANSEKGGTLTESVKAELEKKEFNSGFETKELYAEFAQIVIKKTLKSSFLVWLGKKFFGDPEKIVRSVIDKSLDSLLNTNGYTHALNIVIREQLEEIWRLLQTDQASGQNNFTPEALSLSDVKKVELSGLIKNLFEILPKSKCQTKDELRALIKGQILNKKINEGFDSLFIEEIIEKVTNLLAFALQSLAEKDQLQKLTYKFASLVNRTYETDTKVTLEEMQAEERRISKLSEQILGSAVDAAVNEQLDFTGKNEQDATDHFVNELHKHFMTFYTSSTPPGRSEQVLGLKENLLALSGIDLNDARDETKEIINNKIVGIVASTLAFETQCYDLSFEVRSSTINSRNKDDIGSQFSGIAKQLDPLVKTVTKLKEHHETLKNIQAIVSPLSQIKTIARDVPLRLFPFSGPTSEDLTFCEDRLITLDNNLKELKKIRHLPIGLVETIVAAQGAFATILIDVRKQIKIKAFCTAQSQPNPLIEQIGNERKQSLDSIMKNEALENKLAILTQEIENTFDQDLRPRLLEKLTTIKDAKLSEGVDAAIREFKVIYEQAMTQTNASIETLRVKYNGSQQQLVTAIDATRLLDPNQGEAAKTGIRDSIRDAQNHLQTLATWEGQNVKKIQHLDFAPVPEVMKGVMGFASRFVRGRVKEHLDGFISFLKREDTYRYGLINHLAMIPYVQANRLNKS